MKRGWPWFAVLAVSGCASAHSKVIVEALRAADVQRKVDACVPDEAVPVVVRMTIARDGKVVRAALHAPHDRVAARCVFAALRKIQFAPLPKPTTLTLRRPSNRVETLAPRARVFLAPVSLEGPGALRWEHVYQRVIDRTAPLIDCYRRSLVAKGALVGTVVVRLAIGPGGRVKSVHSAETLAAARLVTCAKSAFVAARFPEPVGGPATVTIPIDFFLAPAQPAPNL